MRQSAGAMKILLAIVVFMTLAIFWEIHCMLQVIQDFKAATDASLAKINTAVDGITGDVAGLKKKIDALIAGGTLGDDDKAALLEIQTATAGIAGKLSALDAATEPETPTPATPS